MNRILVVDDDQMLREVYSLMLSTAGYSVATAFDGKDALKKIKEHKPDLILLDMIMPNLDGVGVMQKLRSRQKGEDIKVIIFSNLSTLDKIDEALNLGAERHLVKSQVTPEQLKIEIQDLLSADN